VRNRVQRAKHHAKKPHQGNHQAEKYRARNQRAREVTWKSGPVGPRFGNANSGL